MKKDTNQLQQKLSTVTHSSCRVPLYLSICCSFCGGSGCFTGKLPGEMCFTSFLHTGAFFFILKILYSETDGVGFHSFAYLFTMLGCPPPCPSPPFLPAPGMWALSFVVFCLMAALLADRAWGPSRAASDTPVQVHRSSHGVGATSKKNTVDREH